MDEKDFEISQKGIEKLLFKTIENVQEERDLSLERYRRQDEAMTTPEDFILQGKNAVDYLKVAADRSNTMLAAVKMMKEIVYKEGPVGGNQAGGLGGGSLDDENKRQILKIIHENNS